MAGPCQNREQGAAPTLAKRARPRPLSEGHLGGSAAPLQPHVGVKTNVQSRGVGVPEGEVSPPSFPPFFPFRRDNASMHPCLGRHPSPFFFFFLALIYFQSFWGSAGFCRRDSKRKVPPARGARSAYYALYAPAGRAPVPAVPAGRSLAHSGHLTGQAAPGALPQRTGRGGGGPGHRTALSHLP